MVRDVLTHDVKLVKQFGSSVLQGVGLADATVGKRVCDNLYALLLKFHVNVLARHYRVAVIMNDAWLAAVDVKLLAAERLYLRVLVERLVEHVDAYLRGLKHVKRLHDDHVNQSVAHRGLRGDVGVVAIL